MILMMLSAIILLAAIIIVAVELSSGSPVESVVAENTEGELDPSSEDGAATSSIRREIASVSTPIPQAPAPMLAQSRIVQPAPRVDTPPSLNYGTFSPPAQPTQPAANTGFAATDPFAANNGSAFPSNNSGGAPQTFGVPTQQPQTVDPFSAGSTLVEQTYPTVQDLKRQLSSWQFIDPTRKVTVGGVITLAQSGFNQDFGTAFLQSGGSAIPLVEPGIGFLSGISNGQQVAITGTVTESPNNSKMIMLTQPAEPLYGSQFETDSAAFTLSTELPNENHVGLLVYYSGIESVSPYGSSDPNEVFAITSDGLLVPIYLHPARGVTKSQMQDIHSFKGIVLKRKPYDPQLKYWIVPRNSSDLFR
jgi:hypothetical protein